jgi:hypothetical protein
MDDPVQALRELCRQVHEEACLASVPQTPRRAPNPAVRQQARQIAAEILKWQRRKRKKV